MEKIAIGSNLPKNLLDIDNGVEKNIQILAEAKKKNYRNKRMCYERQDIIILLMQ